MRIGEISAIRLSARLQAVAALIPACQILSDIGTDHAFLPIYCVQNGIAAQVIAGDIAEGPCAQARRQVQKYHLSNQIQVRCGAGLTVLRIGEVDGITITGMGGSTITSILEASPDHVNQLKFMVLQPQSDYGDLRTWLQQHNWRISAEKLVIDNEIGYQIILAEPGRMGKLDHLAAYYGPLNIWDGSPELLTILEQDLQHYQRINYEMAKSADCEVKQKQMKIAEWIKLITDYLTLNT